MRPPDVVQDEPTHGSAIVGAVVFYFSLGAVLLMLSLFVY